MGNFGGYAENEKLHKTNSPHSTASPLKTRRSSAASDFPRAKEVANWNQEKKEAIPMMPLVLIQRGSRALAT